MTEKTPRTLLLLCVPAAVGMLALLAATRWGLGMTPDSVAYVGAARSLLAGRGVQAPDFETASWAPMTLWPPLFSVLAAGISLTGMEVLAAARWLNATLFAANCLLVGLLVHRHTAGPSWLALLAALVVAGSQHLMDVHLMAWTEPLLTCLALASLLLLATHLQTPRFRVLVAAAVAAALAVLARYLGLVMIAAGLLCLLLFRSGKLRRRILDCAVFALVSCAGPGLWFLRNRLVAGSATSREIALNPVGADKVRYALVAVSRWFLPESFPEHVRIALVAVLLVAGPVLAIMQVRSRKKPADGHDRPAPETAAKIPAVLTIFALLCVAFLIAHISFVDANVPLDNRILSPLHPVLMVLVFCAAWKIVLRFRGNRPARITVIVLLVAFSGWSVQKGLRSAMDRRDSEGFATRPWRESKTVAAVAELPAGVAVYSNRPEAIYHLTGRVTYDLPSKTNRYSRRPNEAYGEQLASMARTMKQRKGLLVYFHEERRWYQPSRQDLLESLPGLKPLQSGAIGTVYVVD